MLPICKIFVKSNTAVKYSTVPISCMFEITIEIRIKYQQKNLNSEFEKQKRAQTNVTVFPLSAKGIANSKEAGIIQPEQETPRIPRD